MDMDLHGVDQLGQLDQLYQLGQLRKLGQLYSQKNSSVSDSVFSDNGDTSFASCYINIYKSYLQRSLKESGSRVSWFLYHLWLSRLSWVQWLPSGRWCALCPSLATPVMTVTTVSQLRIVKGNKIVVVVGVVVVVVSVVVAEGQDQGSCLDTYYADVGTDAKQTAAILVLHLILCLIVSLVHIHCHTAKLLKNLKSLKNQERFNSKLSKELSLEELKTELSVIQFQIQIETSRNILCYRHLHWIEKVNKRYKYFKCNLHNLYNFDLRPVFVLCLFRVLCYIFDSHFYCPSFGFSLNSCLFGQLYKVNIIFENKSAKWFKSCSEMIKSKSKVGALTYFFHDLKCTVFASQCYY